MAVRGSAVSACKMRCREFAPRLRPRSSAGDPFDQAGLDRRLVSLDGTPTLMRLGGNALTAVSLAALQAAAASRKVPLWRYLAGDGPALIPLPEIQIFGGGAHAGRRTDVQDFMIVAPRATSFAEALETTAEVYHAAGRMMAERGLMQGVADEGGWWPAFSSNEQALDALMLAVERAGFAPGEDAAISLDVAASEFGRGGRYRLGLERRELDRDGLAEMLLDWCARYPIVSIEDPFAEDDAEGFRRFTAAIGDRVQVIGDDLLVTNAGRVREAARERSANAVLIKVNQAGTVSDAEGGLRRRPPLGLRNDRVGALGRNRGRLDRPPRGRLGRRPAQSRLVLSLRAHGEMERSPAHRGGAGG